MALCVAAGLAIAAPAAQAQSQAYTSEPVDLYAGPSGDYPVVSEVGPSEPVVVFGCVSDYSWCDIGAEGMRGWVYGGYLTYPYQGSYVPLAGYGAAIGLPIVSFSIGAYWGSFYRDRPWYGERDRWTHARPPGYGPRPPAPNWHGGPARPLPPPQAGGGRPPGNGGPPPGARPPGGMPEGGGRPQGGPPPGNARPPENAGRPPMNGGERTEAPRAPQQAPQMPPQAPRPAQARPAEPPRPQMQQPNAGRPPEPAFNRAPGPGGPPQGGGRPSGPPAGRPEAPQGGHPSGQGGGHGDERKQN
ncbi:SH3 domain-containing protein [Paraburkholderia tropica]|nr:SH3 domain-containing protein [Paraburkholderia tropica]